MKEKINEKLNEAFNKHADVDCPMWCEIATENGTIYLNWHKYQDSEITQGIFKACALIIYAEFKNVNLVQCPWWGLSRESLMNSLSTARLKAAV